MLKNNVVIHDLLKKCESGRNSYLHGTPFPEIHSQGREIFVVSDFHLTVINNTAGNLQTHPEPEVDRPFSDFICHLLDKLSPGKGLLIINGDFVDFIRVTDVPRSNEDFDKWRETLSDIGINKTNEELRTSVSRLERKHGLSTSETKSVWKLLHVIDSHPVLFNALALWIGRGNKIIMVKGNHDLELYWPGVRNLFRLALARHLSKLKKESTERILENELLPLLSFADDKLIIDGMIHVEHGHIYDKFCRTFGGPLAHNSEDINIPFGSFFNIYLLNHIEMISRQNLKNILFEKSTLHPVTCGRHFLGMRVIFSHIPLLFTSIPRHYYRHLFGRVIPFFFMFLFPIFMLMSRLSNSLESLIVRSRKEKGSKNFLSGLLGTRLLRFSEGLALSVLFYFFTNITGKFRLKGINSLPGFAGKNLIEDKRIKIVIMGHTHYPDYFESKGRHYYNTGTWIPTLGPANGAVKRKTDFTFLHLRPAGYGQPEVESLKRWNCKAGQTEPVIMPFNELPVTNTASAG